MAMSAMAAVPLARTISIRSRHAPASIVADVQTSASALTRVGYARVSSIAIIPPSDTPAMAAVCTPAASITAITSSASIPRL
jgi:hypothetical protein